MTKMWWQGPDSPATETTGTSEARWILDGRCLREGSKGEVMGQAFAGIGITGFDNFKKRSVTIWIDSMSAAGYTVEGTYNPDTMTFTFYGTMDEPVAREHDKMVKYVHRIVDADRHVFVIYDLAVSD